MEIIYSGKEVKRLLNESIPGYKPVIGGNASSKNEKINKDANKESIKNTTLDIPKEESKPVIDREGQSTDLGNNKNMLDLQFDNDPGKLYKDRVKKQVTGEDSEFGNKSDESTNNNVNKMFYDAAKKATAGVIKKREELENGGLTGKYIPVDKKNTPFKENSELKIKKLHFKNTKFLSEKHMFSLIPEDYKIDGNVFVMRDKMNEDYFIKWGVNEKTKISEGIISKHENKAKTNEEFNRMKDLYSYKSKDHSGNLTNKERNDEDNKLSNGIKKLRQVSDGEQDN
jgi:hypothetical protein